MFAFLALASALVAQQAPRPSFDCARARAPVEHAICADAELSRLDRRMGERYAAVRRALPPLARTALTNDQNRFLRARNEWFDNRKGIGFRDFPDLRGRMTDRIVFLDAIRTTPVLGPAGRWTNATGRIDITQVAPTRFRVRADTAHPVNARWLCNVQGVGRLENGVLTLAPDGSTGWRLRIAFRASFIEVTETGPGDAVGGPNYCGANGSVAGTYLLSRP